MSISGDRLREYADRAANEGGRAAAAAMAEAGQEAIRRELSRRSHAPETKTPASPGDPPARITGRLWSSITAWPAVASGPYRWISKAGSRGLIYAPVQAYGAVIRVRRAEWLVFRQNGITYRAKQVYIPPRPYVPPAARRLRASGELHEVSVAAFHRAVYG